MTFDPVVPIHSPSPLQPLPPALCLHSPPFESGYDLYPYVPSYAVAGSPPRHVPDAYEPYLPPPTPHPSALPVPPLEHDDGSLVPTHPNTPAPIQHILSPVDGVGSGLAVGSITVVKRLDIGVAEVSSPTQCLKSIDAFSIWS